MATRVQGTGTQFADSASSITLTLSGLTKGNLVTIQIWFSRSDSGLGLIAPPGFRTAVHAPATVTGGTFRIQGGIFYLPNCLGGSLSVVIPMPANMYAVGDMSEWNIKGLDPLDVVQTN